jgi:hypothetical protein
MLPATTSAHVCSPPAVTAVAFAIALTAIGVFAHRTSCQ